MNSGCQEARGCIADYIEGHVEAKTRRQVESHLNTCSDCRRVVRDQKIIREQLRLLARRDARLTPPPHLWEHAAATWNLRDSRRRQTGKLRMAVAGTCLSVFLICTVWAREMVNHEFPIEAALRNFRDAKTHPTAPRYVTEDPDKAAHWLREHLHSDVPPINLSLSQGELLGADIVATGKTTLGRLLYRTPQGLIAVYLAPEGTHFAHASVLPLGNQTFQIMHRSDIGLYGWEANGVGFGLTLEEPIGTARPLALDAAHSSEEKEP